MHLIRLFSICLLGFVKVFTGFSQQDFNHFKNIVADGGIPGDFTSNAYHKIDEDLRLNRSELKGSAEKVFLEGIHYAINDLLHSGMVVYGDEVTTYVDRVAGNLLKDDAKLREKLRFYTIKSNETNAFSTYQGIIFVTTGLISQLSNEAQLAYILSHEIAHYTEKHVVETFDWKIKHSRASDKIQSLSNFSKEHEFEADRLGIKLYHDAGYTKEELISTFDVLLFSYLPFDEVEFSKSYLNSQLMTIPEGFYPLAKYPVKAVEDADDENSSHPNVKRRKEAVSHELESFKDWGDAQFIFGLEAFEYIRTVCRFESVRTDVIDGQFDDALYSIFILEKTYPNSIYLKRMKAKAWLGIAQFKKASILNNKLPKSSAYEGEIASIQFLLRTISKAQASTIAMREIEDLRIENPQDTMIVAIWERMVKTLAYTEKFDLSKYSRSTYQVAYDEFKLNNKDTVKVVNKAEETLSKYEKIKLQNAGSQKVTVFDSSTFYLYAISDLLDSKLFLDEYNAYKQQIEDEEQAEKAYHNLSSSQKKKQQELDEENGLRLNESSVIYIEPIVLSYQKNGVNRIKSEKLAEFFTNSVVSVSHEINMNVITISSSRLVSFGTDGFNERAILMNYLSELTEHDNIDVFPTDYLQLQGIAQDYGTDKVMFSLLEHSYRLDINPSLIALSILIYPIAFAHIPAKIIKGNITNLTVVIIDLKEGVLKGKKYYTYNDPLSKYSMRARIYDVLNQVKSKPLTR